MKDLLQDDFYNIIYSLEARRNSFLKYKELKPLADCYQETLDKVRNIFIKTYKEG